MSYMGNLHPGGARSATVATYSEVARKGDFYVLECTCGHSSVHVTDSGSGLAKSEHDLKHADDRLAAAAIKPTNAVARLLNSPGYTAVPGTDLYDCPHGARFTADWVREGRGCGHMSGLPGLTPAEMAEGAPMSEMRKERDRLSREIVKEVLKNQLAISESDRDEWKRRAEAAEARIANAKPYEFLQSRYATEGIERGPGIAAKSYAPDNSIAWLDEDLLADDVEPKR